MKQEKRKVSEKEAKKILKLIESGKIVYDLKSWKNKFKFYILGYLFEE